MDANRIAGGYELKSELARFCLPPANRDPNRKLAWVNSICILFLVIGLVGAKPAAISVKSPPPIAEIVAAIVETPPPPQTVEPQAREESEPEKSDTPRVVVVTPESPAINFSVPTIGNVAVPTAMAVAPPIAPLTPVAPLRSQPTSLTDTGTGGERPEPPYPKILQEQGEQGSVKLLITVNDTGVITALEVEASSGFTALDRSATEYIRKHWVIPPAGGNHLFETTITYKLHR